MLDFKQFPFDFKRVYLREPDPDPADHINDLRPLTAMLAQGVVQENTPLLTMSLHDRVITFITTQAVYRHVIYGSVEGVPWMVSFCSVCNSGAAFSPVVDTRVHTFGVGGMYDAMVLLYDQESGSYWDHITGRCLHGTLRGRQLTRLSNLLHTTVRQVLIEHPDAVLGQSVLSPAQQASGEEDGGWRMEAQPAWSKGLAATLADEDTRLPRLEMGLGVWSDTSRYYYPISRLYGANNVIFTTLDGRGLLVYIDPESGTPMALFTDASGYEWRHHTLLLNNGDSVRDGVVFTKSGVRQSDRPLQLFSRWYGFAIKFPGCGIYGRGS
ncbi:MAG: DUF3179 domain-containing (seleno)protein [Chloroflexota bacterium]|nr:DUF3179 domain-containing (seleno)protein [Chloroflexota bacterium]